MKYAKYLIFLILPMLLVFACDKIKAPYMKQDTGTVDTVACPVPTFPANANQIKKCLIEDYTGHSCPNCPKAADIASTLKETHGDSIVVMAIHSGYFAEPQTGNYSLDLRCADGETLHDYYGIAANPAGMFNRKEIGGQKVFTAVASWHQQVSEVLAMAPELDIQVIAYYTESNRKLCTHVQTEYLQQTTRNLKIAIYITQDSIIGYQVNSDPPWPTPEIPNYTFMHVLRGSVNGTWGTVLSTGNVAAGTKKVVSYKTFLDPLWEDDFCNIVAIVYDSDNGEIIQVQEAKFIE